MSDAWARSVKGHVTSVDKAEAAFADLFVDSEMFID